MERFTGIGFFLTLIVGGVARSQVSGGEAFVPDGHLHRDDYTVLHVADIRLPEGMAVDHPGGHGKFYARGWQRSDQVLTWDVTVPAEDAYAVNVLLKRDSAPPLDLTVGCGEQAVKGTLPEGVRVWTRQALDGTLRLPAGQQKIALKAQPSGGARDFDAAVLSVELVRPSVRERLQKASDQQRADTRWMQAASYGLMFHWTSQTVPHRGEPKPYAQAVRDFDVPALVEQIRQTGAGFIVLTTSHAQMYFPAPIQALDRVLPGRTPERDLIADLAEALGRLGIKLMLYYHIGAVSDPPWLTASGFWQTDTMRVFGTWESIIGEVGERYGAKLAGWWFDDGTINYYYRSAPWEELTRTARKGYARRLVAYNPWELPSCTGFQDYFCGEGYGNPALPGLPLGPDGHISGGSHAGLQACATLITERDWVHADKNTDIGAPRWKPDQMAGLLKDFIARKNVPIFNLEIYQEGTVSPATVEMFRQARMHLEAEK